MVNIGIFCLSPFQSPYQVFQFSTYYVNCVISLSCQFVFKNCQFILKKPQKYIHILVCVCSSFILKEKVGLRMAYLYGFLQNLNKRSKLIFTKQPDERILRKMRKRSRPKIGADATAGCFLTNNLYNDIQKQHYHRKIERKNINYMCSLLWKPWVYTWILRWVHKWNTLNVLLLVSIYLSICSF